MRAHLLWSALLSASCVFWGGVAVAQQPAPKTPPAGADLSEAPPPPPPWSGASTPTSTAGTQLMPYSPPAAAAAAPVSATPSREAEANDNRIKTLEARIAAEETLNRENDEKLSWLNGFKLSGFLQPQLVWQSFDANASPNASAPGVGPNDVIAKADGTTTNGDFFRLRRARLKAEYMPTKYARMVFEIDPTPAGGPSSGTGTIARNVEAVGIVPWTDDIVTEYGMGIFKIPFGCEILQNDADRVFIERSFGEQVMFPGEYDTGARAYGTFLQKKLAMQVAVINGITIGEKTFAVLPDLNKGKDVVARASYDFGPFDVGLSGYYGQGQNVDAADLKFKQFPRMAGNVEAALHHTFLKRVGATRVLSEMTFGRNMDRGVQGAFALPAIPTIIGSSVRGLNERSIWVRVEQDITEWITLAARYDFYSPDTSQKNNARDTYAFVGAVHFTKGLKLLMEFDHAIDNTHKLNAPPPAKHIETFSSVLQVRF